MVQMEKSRQEKTISGRSGLFCGKESQTLLLTVGQIKSLERGVETTICEETE